MIFRDQIYSVLKAHPEQRFTYIEVAQLIFEAFRDDCEKTRTKSKQDLAKDSDLIWQLAANVAANREDLQSAHPDIKTTEGRPRKYFYSEKPEGSQVPTADIASSTNGKESKKSEYDLYSVLYQFMKSDDSHVYTRRIDEKKSSNKQGKGANHWLHPDLVGIEILDILWSRKFANARRHSAASVRDIGHSKLNFRSRLGTCVSVSFKQSPIHRGLIMGTWWLVNLLTRPSRS